MVGIVGNILPPVLREQVTALKRTARVLDETQLQLATGLRVNRAIDDPQNFFTSFDLKNTASDLSRLLDGINISIRTIQAAEHGTNAVLNILEQADAYVAEGLAELRSASGIDEIILADDPVAYWRLNETSGNTAENLGTEGIALDGTYVNGVTLGENPVYPPGDLSARFDGSNNQRVNIPDSPLLNTQARAEITVELTFNADTVDGRYVLYEEGGNTNNLALYIDDGLVRVTARDAGDYGPFDISAPIEAGKSYHLALTLDDPNGVFIGYLNGEVIGTGAVTRPLSSHTNDIAIGAMRQNSHLHDGNNSGNDHEFIGRISDVAVYNSVISQEGIRERYEATALDKVAQLEAETLAIIEELDQIVEDTSFRGINLLSNENLLTTFNPGGSSNLLTEGTDFSSEGLGVTTGIDFHNLIETRLYLDDLREALGEVRGFGRSLATDLSIITIREDFTRETINTHESGADDLVVADQNELGASFLALQTRQQIQFSVLAFAGSSSTGILL